ncbi:MAG: transcription antitermination factor NusB [Deltaproteobacteria bacterium]|nr:transcription antitermination factor NusB [Deltaproteobacteria bacterium]
MNVRRKARESALQILYRIDIAEGGSDEALGPEMHGLAPGSEARRYCSEIVKGVAAEKEAIDREIEKYSENWSVERMAVVDRNILRVAVYELIFSRDVPYKVVIDEAVELAKRYGSEDSGAFINGVLDRVHRARHEALSAEKI